MIGMRSGDDIFETARQRERRVLVAEMPARREPRRFPYPFDNGGFSSEETARLIVETYAKELDDATAEVKRLRTALERIQREDHEHGPGWFAEIAAEALHGIRSAR